MSGIKCDFSGWATKNDLRCNDGRIIRKDAFQHNNGDTVPLVWNHQHNSVDNIIGHALLENRDEGVYAYGTFNDTPDGQHAKELVKHGDIRSLSIFANRLKEQDGNVLHGAIREVSLVLAGANPGAFIESVMAHGDTESGIIVGYDENLMLYHSDVDKKSDSDETVEDVFNTLSEKQKEVVYFMIGQALENDGAGIKHSDNQNDNPDETVEDVFNTLSEKQKEVVYFMIGQAMSDNKEETNMKHNIFDQGTMGGETGILSHAEQGEILGLAKSSNVGSLQMAMEIFAQENQIEHSDISGFAQTGDGNITTLFPEFVEAHPSATPELITNDMGWVDAIMAKTQKIPHGRVRTSHVDIRNIDALKAKGYKKGNEKKITGTYDLVRRTTDPQTVYVTSELHRDDVVDMEDFDYVNFQYKIDQMSLKETLAVATMLGDDRLDSDKEKIFPEHIRPIWTDDELYTIHKDIDYAAMAKELQGTDAETYFGKSFVYAEAMVTALRMARKDFRGTGKPDLFMTTDMHNTMILARDRNGRRIYEKDTDLAAALGVNKIYEVTQFEDRVRTDATGKKHKLHAICVNMADYGYGSSKGGDITHFTDFDIKFNQLLSLLETRKSGQLTRIKSAIVIEELETEAEQIGG